MQLQTIDEKYNWIRANEVEITLDCALQILEGLQVVPVVIHLTALITVSDEHYGVSHDVAFVVRKMPAKLLGDNMFRIKFLAWQQANQDQILERYFEHQREHDPR